MMIFNVVVGAGLVLQGLLALGARWRWQKLPITLTLRRLVALAYFCLGAMFVLSAFWRQLYIGVFVALIFLIIVQRKIVLQRKMQAGLNE